jgi:hypothetical protein
MFEIQGPTNGPEYIPLLPAAAAQLQLADANFNVIPLPAAAWMLLSAIAGLGFLGRGAARSRTA